MNIKSLICLIASMILLSLFFACSLSEKEKTSEDDNLLDSAELIENSRTANVNLGQFEMDFNDKKFIFKGDVIQKDNGVDFKKINNSFIEQKDNGNLFPTNPTSLELEFSNSIPRSVTWYGIYVRDGDVIYSNLTTPQPVDNVDAKTILPIGINLAVPLDSALNVSPVYRVIRIVCEFDDQTVEYSIFFDCFAVESSTP